LTLIWLTVVKEKTVSLSPCMKVDVSAIAPGHNQRRDPFGDDWSSWYSRVWPQDLFASRSCLAL